MLLLRTQQPRIDLADFKKLSRKQLNHHVNVEARAFMRALSGPFWVSSAILTVTLIAFRKTTLMANVLGSFGPVLGPALAAPTNPDPEPQAGRNPDLPTVTPTRECDEGPTEDEYDSADKGNVDEEAPLPDNQDFPDHFPKIHINGGSDSGVHTWKRIMKQVQAAYNPFKLSKQGRGGSCFPRSRTTI